MIKNRNGLYEIRLISFTRSLPENETNSRKYSALVWKEEGKKKRTIEFTWFFRGVAMTSLSLVQSRTWYEKFNDSSAGNSTIRWRCSALMAGHRAFPSVVARMSLPFPSKKRGCNACLVVLPAVQYIFHYRAFRVTPRGLSMFHASTGNFARAWRSFALWRWEKKRYPERMTNWFPNVSTNV